MTSDIDAIESAVDSVLEAREAAGLDDPRDTQACDAVSVTLSVREGIALLSEIDRLRSRLDELERQEPVVPEGYALVPKRMPFDAGDLQCLLFMSGDPHNEDEFSECFLWVGETFNVNGDTTEKRYGLNVTNSEYPEEGSTPFVEFARPPASRSEAEVKAGAITEFAQTMGACATAWTNAGENENAQFFIDCAEQAYEYAARLREDGEA